MTGAPMSEAGGKNLEAQLAAFDAQADLLDDDREIRPGREAEYRALHRRQQALDGRLQVIRQVESRHVPMSLEVARHAARQASRPRERRSSRRSGSSRAGPSDPSDPEPPPSGRPSDDVDPGSGA